MTILFYSNRPSNGLNNLKDAINEASRGMAIRLRSEGSTRRISNNDLLVNWGCSSMTIPNLHRVEDARFLNAPSAVANAANKKKAFELFRAENVPTVEWTEDEAVAQTWLDAGAIVYSRTRLSGHSGEGIVLSFNNPSAVGDAGTDFTVQSTLPRAPLYTKAVMGGRREWRVHVMNGQVIHVQQKKRANGFDNNPAYSNLVRNHSTGWIYATSDIQLPAGVADIACNAISALGLDFGAVDIITRQGSTYVLEVNTACGQEAGQTLEAYVRSLVAVHNRQPIPAAVQPTAVGTSDSDVEPEPAVAASRSLDSLNNEASETKNNLFAYINSTSHLNVDGGFHRTAFVIRVRTFYGEYIENPSEGTLRVFKNKCNKLKAAIQRFGDKANSLYTCIHVNLPYQVRVQLNNLPVPVSSPAGTTYARRAIAKLVKDTAAEVSEEYETVFIVSTTDINTATRIANELADNAERARQSRLAARAAQVAPVEVPAVSDVDTLEINLSFVEWLRSEVRAHNLTASQIISILNAEQNMNVRAN